MDHLKSKSLQNSAWLYQVQKESKGSDTVWVFMEALGQN